MSAQRATSRQISVDYRRIDGWHVFTSEEVRGLYVADKDLRTAYQAVAPSIEFLLAENQHIAAKVRPAMGFERWCDYLRMALTTWFHRATRLTKRVELPAR